MPLEILSEILVQRFFFSKNTIHVCSEISAGVALENPLDICQNLFGGCLKKIFKTNLQQLLQGFLPKFPLKKMFRWLLKFLISMQTTLEIPSEILVKILPEISRKISPENLPLIS